MLVGLIRSIPRNGWPIHGQASRRRIIALSERTRQWVVTADLARVLQQWLDNSLAEVHNNYLGVYQTTPVSKREFVPGVITPLAAALGIDPRKLRAILKVEHRVTNLWLADRVLNAIGKEHMLRTGDIRVLENYNSTNTETRGMSMEEWFEWLGKSGHCTD
jgi:hypothetical protein